MSRQQRHYLIRLVAPALAYGLVGAYLLNWLDLADRAWWVSLLLMLIIEIVALALYSPHALFLADIRATQLTGDAESFVSALAELSRLNQAKLDWRLLERIAGATGIRPDRLRELIERHNHLPEDRYSTSGDYFTTGF